MDEQFAHLEQLAGRPGVIIQVAPYSLGEHRPFAHPLYLLTLANHAMLGYTESHHQGYLERESDTVRTWAGNYNRLQVGALSEAASLDLIRRARKEQHDRAR
jgi:hypothetical protein